MIKKFAICLLTIFFSASVFSFVAPANAFARAQEECKAETSSALSFLSFPTWYRGLGECNSAGEYVMNDMKGREPTEIIFKVALNVVDIALRLAALLAVGFIIYGGFLIMTAQGASDKVKNGRTAITRAVVGLVIATLAAFIVSFIVSSINPS